MTTTVKIKNEGPDQLLVRYYNEQRQFHGHDLLTVGQEIEVTVWNGKLPVMWPVPHGNLVVSDDPDGPKLFAIPPAHY